MLHKPASDAAVRHAAIHPQESILVQAPAGSGKTELLTDRILALLACVNRPEEILAITFTRKAASEMHARVMKKLQSSLGPEPDKEHEKQGWRLGRQALARDAQMGWNLLQHPARLSIRTIDAFCSWLVRAMPWSSSLGGLPGIVEDSRTHYLEAARATLALAEEDACVARLIEHLDVNVHSAQELIADMLGSRDQWLPFLSDSDDAELLQHNLEEIVQADLQRLAQLMPHGWSSSLAGPIRMAISSLQAADKPCPFVALLDWDGAVIEPIFAQLERWQALAEVLLTKSAGLRKRLDKNLGFEPKSAHKESLAQWLDGQSSDDPWVVALDKIRGAPVGGYQPAQLEMLSNLVHVLRLAAGQLILQFAENKEVDFIEIAQRALYALGTAQQPSELLLKLDASISHLLVDEFQDTSQSQLNLLALLTAGWEPGDGRTVFLVGDPMQSIYRFRKAEVGLFLKVRDEGLNGLPLRFLQLTDNFRSQANIVAWVNKVFQGLFPQVADADMGAISYSASTAYKDRLGEVGVEMHPVWTPASVNGPAAAVAAQAIVVELARQAFYPASGEPATVAILVRARSHLEDVVRRLVSAGIPCRAVELSPLKSRQAVSDAVQLARALAHPADRLAWLSVLRSPLCGLTLHTLHALFGADHHRTPGALLSQWLRSDNPQAVPADEAQRIRYAAEVLLDQSNASGAIPFAAWLQNCWERLGGPAIYHGAGDRADVESLFRLVEKLAPYGGLDPAELEARLERLFAAPLGAGRAVEVMTIHKSKGLQFDTVILMGLHRRPRNNTEPLLRLEHSDARLLLGPIRDRSQEFADPISSYLAQREKLRGAHEVDRLLYVAVTRARTQLHLVMRVDLDEAGQPKSAVSSSLLGRLWPHINLPEPPGIDELQAEPQQQDETHATPHFLQRMRLESLPQPQPAKIPSEASSAWQWPVDLTHEAAVGTVAHSWLERLGREGSGDWDSARLHACLPVLRRQLSRAGLPPEQLDDGAALVFETLSATLSSERGQWLLGVAQAQREWSLLDLSGRVSVVDLAISQEEGWLVVDYKTSVPHADESAEAFSERMRQHYELQLKRYCEQVSALDGRPARAALYFPRADLWLEC